MADSELKQTHAADLTLTAGSFSKSNYCLMNLNVRDVKRKQLHCCARTR